ncbi:MAG: HAD-IA family hydrolase [Myxococcota bacterium]
MTPPFNRIFAAILFDMDGTLINSIAVAERVWGAWARRHGLDVAKFLPTIHGRRVPETIAGAGIPGIDIARESAEITAAELEDVEGIVPIPGAIELLASVPAERQALVTSAPRALALRRLAAAGITPPRIIVSGDDVSRGKPAPACYLLAAQRLGIYAADCLVVEDTPAGIAAGETAGATVLVINATHHEPLITPHTQRPSFASLRIEVKSDGWLRVRETG